VSESATVEQIYPDPRLFASWREELRNGVLHVATDDPQPAARMWQIHPR